MAKSSDASRVMLSSVADRSADSGTSSAVVRRDDNWISWRVLATLGGEQKDRGSQDRLRKRSALTNTPHAQHKILGAITGLVKTIFIT